MLWKLYRSSLTCSQQNAYGSSAEILNPPSPSWLTICFLKQKIGLCTLQTCSWKGTTFWCCAKATGAHCTHCISQRPPHSSSALPDTQLDSPTIELLPKLCVVKICPHCDNFTKCVPAAPPSLASLAIDGVVAIKLTCQCELDPRAYLHMASSFHSAVCEDTLLDLPWAGD